MWHLPLTHWLEVFRERNTTAVKVTGLPAPLYLKGNALIIMSHGKTVVPNVLTVFHEQHGWLSWAMAAAALGLGLPITAGCWLFVGVMGQPCRVGSSGRNRKPVQGWWPFQEQVELLFAILYTLFLWSWGPGPHVLNWRRTSSPI